MVRRAIHAAADYEMADIMDAHEKALDSIVQALSGGCRIIVDVQMVESGLSKPHLSANGNTVFCHVSDPDVRDEATRLGLTRSTMAMRKAKQAMEGAVVVVGNAPTALFEVVRLIREEGVRPSGIVGVPVGFVGASESKELLSRVSEVPWIVTRGPKGGSTVAVAITNALLEIGEGEVKQEIKGDGAEGQNRTADTRLFRPLLYRLSYLGTGGDYKEID